MDHQYKNELVPNKEIRPFIPFELHRGTVQQLTSPNARRWSDDSWWVLLWTLLSRILASAIRFQMVLNVFIIRLIILTLYIIYIFEIPHDNSILFCFPQVYDPFRLAQTGFSPAKPLLTLFSSYTGRRAWLVAPDEMTFFFVEGDMNRTAWITERKVLEVEKDCGLPYC
jgi:hypothetical protein